MNNTPGMTPTKVLAFLWHIPNFIKLCFRLLHDSRVPFHLRLICWGSILYFFFPIDLIRDFPRLLFGRVDDVLILVYAFRKLIMDSPKEIVYEHVKRISEGR